MKDFADKIRENIFAYCLIEYGCIGSQFLVVLIIKDNKIVPIGQILYRAYRERLASDDVLLEFGEQYEKYRIGKRKTMPVCCYHTDILSTDIEP